MSASKPTSRSGAMKKDGNFRSANKQLAIEKGKRTNNAKESATRKACDCLLKSENWKTSKLSQNSKLPVKKTGKAAIKDGKRSSAEHQQKVVIVSKRSSSVSVVKSCNLRKSVSVRKVSYSTSVVLSSEEDSDSEEDEDSEYEEKRKSKKKTVLKRTTSKMKSNFTTKKSDRAAKKAKAIKLLCEKLSSSSKKSNERELRPRFPYSMLQEWPTARAHRMASLNALAKVHVLYENESRTTGENLKDADEHSLIDFLNEENSDDDDNDDDDDDNSVDMDIKQNAEKKNEKSKNLGNEKSKNEKKSKVQQPIKRVRKRKSSDVEIIDTRVCKRMASLNAQAILAASYVTEPKPKRILKKPEKNDTLTHTCDMDVKVVVESKCDLEIIETENKTSSPKMDTSNFYDKKLEIIPPPDLYQSDSKNSDSTDIVSVLSPDTPYHASWRVESDVAVRKSCQSEIASSENNIVSTTASTKVGMTQYTEVTKVQINSRNDMEVKEESKSERKIERILGNDDVAITQMYHYQSKNTNESYCVQMQTTYKPGSRNLSPAIPISPPNSMHPHIGDPVLRGRPGYYGPPCHNAMLPAPPYHINPSVSGLHPVMTMDHRIPHQYGGSAFSVPHYRHPQPMQFPHGEYGYYQPAGPLIQSHHDQYTIHKPVPYHPQPNPHQPPQRPQPSGSHMDSYDPSRVRHKNSSAVSDHHATNGDKQNSKLPETETSQAPQYKIHSERSPTERGIKSAPFSTSPKPISPSALQSQYSTQSGYRDYHKQKSPTSVGNYPKHYEPNIPLSTDNSYNIALPPNIPYHKNKSPHSSVLMESREPGRHETHVMSHQQLKMPHHCSYSHSTEGHKNYSDNQVRESNWSIKTNRNDSPDTPPVTFIPYQMEPSKEISSITVSESPRYPIRPPSVIEIIEDNSRDTKTYIQLEVPKNSHREKIVVVDVEDDEINKECDLPNSSTTLHFDISQGKDIMKQKDEICSVTETEINETDPVISDISCKSQLDTCQDQTKESPDIMVIEIKKKKESAVVRRARLHGKQRTFRDSYNRPLVPLSKVKKNDATATEESSKTLVTQESSKKVVTHESSKKVAAQESSKIVTSPEVILMPILPPPKSPEKKFPHGWSWEGQSFQKQVYVSNDESPCIRHCYPAIKHVEGDVIYVRDCVLLRSGLRKTDLPFVAKITALWDNPIDGEMTMSLMWYYRPEHTQTEKKLHHIEDEIFASKHKDTNSVACIEDKCYILTYSEYCRYRKRCKMLEEGGVSNPTSIVPEIDEYPRTRRLPPINVSPDLVFFCRKVYDFRQKRLLKNPV